MPEAFLVRVLWLAATDAELVDARPEEGKKGRKERHGHQNSESDAGGDRVARGCEVQAIEEAQAT